MGLGRVFGAAALLAAGACLGCADRQSPAWGAGAAVEAVEAGDTWLAIAWPAAEDRRGVTGYRVARGGERIAELAAGEGRELRIEALAEFTEYEIEVVALDEAGNASEALAGTLRTADITAPYWGIGVRLRGALEEEGETPRLTLSWGEAGDNDRVSRFVVSRDGEEILTAEPAALEAVIEDGQVAGEYAAWACDPSENCGRVLRLTLDERGKDVAREQARIARQQALDREIAQHAGILAALGEFQSVSGFGDTEFAGDGLDWGGLLGDAVDEASGAGGLRARGSGLGGSGTAEGIGGLGTVGHGGGGASGYGTAGMARSTYRAPGASVSGAEPALVAHAEKRRARIEHCYDNALAEQSGLSGTLTAALSADAEGAVTVGGVSGAGGTTLTSCVATALRGRLGEAPGAPLSGSVTIQLDPGSR